MSSKREEDIFHFVDDGEDYDFVLPPEYKISQDRPHPESASGDESHEQVDGGDTQGRRVSFDTERNEYYYVERCSDQEMYPDGDEELRLKEYEIEMPLEQELAKGRVDMEGVEEELEREETSCGSSVDACVQSRKPFLENLPGTKGAEGPLRQTMDDGRSPDQIKEGRPEDGLAETAGNRILLDSNGGSGNGQVVRESLPSIKDNPFIQRDKMNLK